MIRVPVTSLDKYAAYMDDEDFPLDQLLRELRGQVPRTPAMERGHAFAVAMEHVGNGSDLLIAEGHAFAFTCDVEIEVWLRRELKAEKDYGGIIVSARCDRLHGKIIADDKTTESFSKSGVEKYIEKWQWRYYLDIFGAQEFVWHVWECREVDAGKYEGVHGWEVFAHHVIRNYRYPELEAECREFALSFKQFAERASIYA